MAEFKYKLGEIVLINPAKARSGIKGKIIGQTVWIDSTVGYVVSALSIGHDAVLRHSVYEVEVTPIAESS